MKPFSNNVPFASIVVITEKVYFSAHSPSVSGAWKTRCKAWCFLCLGWRCHDNLLQDLRQRVTKLWRRSWKHPYGKMLRLFVMCIFLTPGVRFMLIWIPVLTVWQVTGHRSGHRPQVTLQVTGHRSQATGQVTGHTKNNRTLDKTVLDWRFTIQK